MADETLRLLADDLTGALDSAAQFAPRLGPIICFLDPPLLPPLSCALDTGTREQSGEAAAAAVRTSASLFAGAGIAFKKIDSLLRGHEALEIAACLAASSFRATVIAPAFPAQGRATRFGRQWARGLGGEAEGWTLSATDLAAALSALGHPVRHARPGDPAPDGVSLWDAETEADLERIVAAGRAVAGPVLWCGTAGLAAALAGAPSSPPPALARPLLGLFGSDHAAMQAQLALCSTHHVAVAADRAANLRARLAADGVALASFALPPRLARDEAAARIAATIESVLTPMPELRTLIVAGGETLRVVVRMLGASHLVLLGQMRPGVPLSRPGDGAWQNVRIVSKSGAFGEPDLLRRLLEESLI